MGNILSRPSSEASASSPLREVSPEVTDVLFKVADSLFGQGLSKIRAINDTRQLKVRYDD
jgi:hypothetical protein